MDNGISPWDLSREAELAKSRAAFEASPDYAALVAQAAARGFRRITLHEQLNPLGVDAYSWRGGVWVKSEVAA